MKITLYKNCILNNQYNDLIHHTALNNYLNNLEKRVIIINENFYLGHKGKITLDIEYFNLTSPYYQLFYNYMLIENTDFDIQENRSNPISKFYAFINNIEVVNECVIVYYEEDIFSTWERDFKIGKSLLTNSRNLRNYNLEQDINFYKLPMKYEGNNRLAISNHLSNNSEMGDNNDFLILGKAQFYKLSQGTSGEVERYNSIGIFGTYSLQSGVEFDIPSTNIEFIINTLIRNKNTTTYEYKNSGEYYYFELNEIYVIPKNFFNKKLQDITTADCILKLGTDWYWFDLWEVIYKNYGDSQALTNPYKKYIIKSLSISNDFKIISVGTLSTQINLSRNGSFTLADISILVTPYELNLFIEIENQIIDITNDFLIDAPIEAIDSETYQLRKMNIESKNALTKRQVIDETLSGSQKVTNDVLNALGGIINIANKNPLGATQAIGGTVNTGFDIGKSINSIESLQEQMKFRNKEIYENAKAISTKSYGFQNAIMNLIVLKIAPDNENQVNNLIDNCGYLVNEIVNNVLDISQAEITNIVQNKNGYDIMKFGFTRVYGAISQDINNKITDILHKGFRIWFTENINV